MAKFKFKILNFSFFPCLAQAGAGPEPNMVQGGQGFWRLKFGVYGKGLHA
jgi:hypothetical protein